MKPRITLFTDSFVVGEKVWIFYRFLKTKSGIAEGIFEGVIVSFSGFSLNVAKIYNEALNTYIDVNIRQLNKVEN